MNDITIVATFPLLRELNLYTFDSIEMSNIVKHIFSLSEKLPIYSDNSGTNVKGYLSKGEWLGVLSMYQSRLKVITSKIDGWVNADECTSVDQKMNRLTARVDEDQIRYYLPI